ncbi:class I SAM-dependent methyltransferase [Lederbergia sp. NSJ-179]|uniref:class I SAM-dependent methyltransferase n=1 Tax=Lederbergia sp. NSJ-179 TaxID=2931402 RepID=UPI001FD22B65|nr:class I SAM-dependent methyltransferase [Lederbergia sp. NSJ-179]MCJ7843609.1 class I SAM-dependent methyltransferase [Lederbergia sp. NSJ-179]
MFPDLSNRLFKGTYKERMDHIAAESGKYEYTCHFKYEGISAEDILTEELRNILRGGKVLDVGCGHGEYTNSWSDYSEEVVGYDIDMTEGFIETANRKRKPNVRYVIGNTKDGLGLPFPTDYFDVVYTKKGPTSWFPEGNRVVKPGGTILLLYLYNWISDIGDYYKGWIDPNSNGAETLNIINERLAKSGFEDIRTKTIEEIAYIPTPEDVINYIFFGQSKKFTDYVKEQYLEKVQRQFEKYTHDNGSDRGIKVTNYYCLIRAGLELADCLEVA